MTTIEVPSPEDLALFWIRMGGLLMDERDEQAARLDRLAKQYGASFLQDPRLAPMVTLSRAYDDLVDVLTRSVDCARPPGRITR